MVKPLIFIPSVRDLPEVKEAVDKLPYDKLWVKYMKQGQAYVTGRNFFLSHPEYTHLVINPDDLIVKPDQLAWLLSLTRNTNRVVSGWCVHGKTRDPRVGLDTNISFHLYKGDPHVGTYEDYKHITIEEVNKFHTGDMIKEVKFSGFAPTIIPRDVVHDIPFKVSQGDCCVDSYFAQDLDKLGIKQYVDFRICTKELKAADLDIYGHLGKKAPQVILNGSSI